MGVYDFDNIPDLSEEEKKNPYSSFYYVPVGKPLPEVFAAIQPGIQMDPALALDIEDPGDVKRLFLPDALPCRNGWCVMPDGTGYSAIETVMEGVTHEMEAWWAAWFSADDTHYKIWLPGLHVSHRRPVCENLGWGEILLDMLQPISPAMLGVDDPKALDPRYMAFYGSSGKSVPRENPDAEPDYTTILNCVKSMENGIKVQSLAYSGVRWQDGKLIRMIPENESADIEKVRLFATHNAYEFARKAVILPGLYELSKTL